MKVSRWEGAHAAPNGLGPRVYSDDRPGRNGLRGFFVRKYDWEDRYRISHAVKAIRGGWLQGMSSDRTAPTRRDAVLKACAMAGCQKAQARLALEAM